MPSSIRSSPVRRLALANRLSSRSLALLQRAPAALIKGHEQDAQLVRLDQVAKT